MLRNPNDPMCFPHILSLQEFRATRPFDVEIGPNCKVLQLLGNRWSFSVDNEK
jgi:hypothetical protein